MMNAYIILMRGINVGGKNKVPMAGLGKCLEELGFSNVSALNVPKADLVKSLQRRPTNP